MKDNSIRPVTGILIAHKSKTILQSRSVFLLVIFALVSNKYMENLLTVFNYQRGQVLHDVTLGVSHDNITIHLELHLKCK